MENQLEQKQQEIMLELQKSVDKQIKEQIADKVSEFINNNKIAELAYCLYIEDAEMAKAKEEFNKLNDLIKDLDYNQLIEQEKDKYDQIKEARELVGTILNLNHLVIVSNKESLCTEYKMKYLPNHVNLQYIQTDKVDGTYAMNRGQVKFDMIEEPTFDNPTNFKANIEITGLQKFPEEVGCDCKLDGCPICFEPKLND